MYLNNPQKVKLFNQSFQKVFTNDKKSTNNILEAKKFFGPIRTLEQISLQFITF